MRICYVNLNGHFQDSAGVERNDEEGELRYSKDLMTMICVSSFRYCWYQYYETQNMPLISPDFLNGLEKASSYSHKFSKISIIKRTIVLLDLRGLEREKDNRIMDLWRTMEKIFYDIKFDYLGLINATRQQLTCILNQANTKPLYFQLESSVQYPNSSMLSLIRSENLIPVVTNIFGKFPNLLETSYILPTEEKLVIGIAEKYNKSPGQILVKHALQKNVCPLVQSTLTSRLIAYSEIGEFDLTNEEMHLLNTSLIQRKNSDVKTSLE
ncbi:unnamed protein product [Hymenolepis diminuta]|uniref:NADP-dependent oxidoreductase domain-containing protein n=1 Tax=Hymenolepis diminuta TaxID=6216 RepID=A0A564YUQ0_HYMDI|nr:unnamed protein product [Hymenolepis diminuta]